MVTPALAALRLALMVSASDLKKGGSALPAPDEVGALCAWAGVGAFVIGIYQAHIEQKAGCG